MSNGRAVTGPSAFVAPEGDPYIWDSDSTIDRAQPNLQVPVPVAVGDFLEVTYYTDKSNTTYHLARVGGGGSSLIWLTTDNTGLSFEFGARYDRPQGTGTALTVDDAYYIATPWNTRIAAPNNYFAYFVQAGQEWYHHVEQFYVKPSSNYPSGSGAGITTFTCYLNKADTSLNLGANGAFPAGIKCIQDGFDNVNAGTNSLNYFNGKIFEASFDARRGYRFERLERLPGSSARDQRRPLPERRNLQCLFRFHRAHAVRDRSAQAPLAACHLFIE